MNRVLKDLIVSNELKACPCGNIPKRLCIEGQDRDKYMRVTGDCCSEWAIEFRAGYAMLDDPELLVNATEAWNNASRPTEPKTKWISVDDRLPEENTWSIVYAKHRPDVDGIVCLNPFKNGKFSEYTAVTHWQSLPDIPNCDEVEK